MSDDDEMSEPIEVQRPDLAAARAQMSGALRSMSLGGQLALRSLERVLSSDESVLCLAMGYLRGKGVLAVLTSERVLVMHGGFVRKADVDIPLRQVSMVTQSHALLLSRITIHSSAGRVEVDRVQPGDARAFVAGARDLVGMPSSVGVDRATREGNADVVARIRELGELRRDGILGEEEFEEKKKDLLSRL